MSQIPLQVRAMIVPIGNRPGFSGTLSDCLSHWHDNLTIVERATSFIALDEALEGRTWLEPWEVKTLASRTTWGAFNGSCEGVCG